MKGMKERPWQVLLALLFVITAVIEFMSIHNHYAGFVMIAVTLIVLIVYYILLKVFGFLDSGKNSESKILREWIGMGFVHGGLIAAIISMVALGTSVMPNTSVYWPGIILTDCVIVIAILLGGAIGIHRGVQDES